MQAGSHHTPEARAKMSLYRAGRPRGPHSLATRRKLSLQKLGAKNPMYRRPISDRHRGLLSEAHRGPKAWNWIPDRTRLRRLGDDRNHRRSAAYVTWRKDVWKRDNFRCRVTDQNCNGRIEAHHILSWRDYPELRYQVNNGITLCHRHHPHTRVAERELQPVFQRLVAETSGF